MIINEKYLEGNGGAIIEVFSHHMPGGTDKNHERTQYNWCPDQDSN
jgi:hypothetical protein